MRQLPPEDGPPGGVLHAIDGGRPLDSLDPERLAAGLARLELMVNGVLDRLTEVETPESEG